MLYLHSTEGRVDARCGGSLINNKLVRIIPYEFPIVLFYVRFVLTAAHCTQDVETSGAIKFLFDDITIVLGEGEMLEN